MPFSIRQKLRVLCPILSFSFVRSKRRLSHRDFGMYVTTDHVSHANQKTTRFFQRIRTVLVWLLEVGAISFLLIIMFVLLVWFSAMPWTFTYLLVGKLIGASSSLEVSVLILLVVTILLISIIVSKKIEKKRAWREYLLRLGISFLIVCLLTFSFSLIFMSLVSQADGKIQTFITENENLSFQDYVANITGFLNNNVHAAWDTPEASFAINRLICSSKLDPYIMKIYGVTAGDLVVYQGWGSCGEAAILIEELLHRAGYEARLAYFKGIDHEWAEAKYNGTWTIVDPWYIGNLVDAKSLKNAKPAFQQATGVEVQYENGTVVDASHEHGY